jgi:AcrR family transcriptional regulator
MTQLAPPAPRVPRRTQAERTAASRARLLDAAVESLAELGYHGTSLPEVVRRAGLSNGALWRHYRSKNDLLVAAALHCEEKLAAAALQHDLSGLPPQRRLDTAVDMIWDWVHTPSFAGLLELLSVGRADAELRSALLANDTRAGRIFFDVVAHLVGPELASAEGFERAVRVFGLTMYGVALTAGLRSPAADARLRAEIRGVVESLFDSAGETR